MGKHSAKASSMARNTALFAAVGVGVAVLAPASAQAAPAVHNPSGFSFDIPEQYVPQVQPYLAQANVSLSDNAPEASSQGSVPALPSGSQNQGASDAAKSQVGAPYVWGGSSPAGFDCSGLIQWAYSQAGKEVPRTSDAQIAGGTPVAMSDIQIGDIVGYYGGNSHVAMYIGDGQVVHAINSGTPVKITDINYMPVNSIARY